MTAVIGTQQLTIKSCRIPRDCENRNNPGIHLRYGRQNADDRHMFYFKTPMGWVFFTGSGVPDAF